MNRNLTLLTLFWVAIFFSELRSQTSISGVVNFYRRVTSITTPVCDPCALSCKYQITVTNSAGFFPGDKVLIIQMKGADINTTNTAAGGTITAINNAGNYEFFVVDQIVGNVLYTKFPLIRTYTPGTMGGYVQVVRILKDDHVVLSDTVKALPWDDNTGVGGVIALEARKITMNAPFWVLGQGYQGQSMGVNGTPDNCSIDPTTQYTLPNTNNSSWQKGHGIVVDNLATNRGRSPRANGGGSGVSGDTGGGGGSSYGAGGNGGWRWCDVGGTPAGGTGGVTLAPYYAMDRVYMGGAGGPGWVSTNNPSQASNGGGIVILFCDTLEGNGQTIEASGTNPKPVNPTGAPDGGGGGGGGGSVVLKVNTFLGNLSVKVNGGTGQDLNTTIYHGPGGGGGGGVLLYSLPTLPPTVSVNSSGGRGGQHLDGFRNQSQDGQPGSAISLYIPVQNANYYVNFGPSTVPIACDKDDDNDGILDIVEAYDGDHDGDGVPDWKDPQFCTDVFAGVNGWNCAQGLPDPSGDLDGDGRLNYEDPDFPGCGGLNAMGVCRNYDRDGDGRPDHLDLDSDNDGIPDLVENGGVDTNGDGMGDSFADEDRDGILDIFDVNCTGVLATGSASSVYFTSGTVSNGTFAADANPATGATLSSNGAFIDVQLPSILPIGTVLTLRLAGGANNGTGAISQSDDGATYINAQPYSVPGTPTITNVNYTLTADAQYIRISRTHASITSIVYHVSYSYMPCGGVKGVNLVPKDTDKDGILDSEDLDSDNDGIPDIVEAGGVDTNGDGYIDFYNPLAGVFYGVGDADKDGLFDLYDGGCTPSVQIFSGNAFAQATVGNVIDPDNALGPVDNTYAQLLQGTAPATAQTNTGTVTNPANALTNPPVSGTYAQMSASSTLTLDVGAGNLMYIGSTINLYLSNGRATALNFTYEFSTDGITFTNLTNSTLAASAAFAAFPITMPVTARYIRITADANPNNLRLRVHGLTYNTRPSIDLVLDRLIPTGQTITVRLAKISGTGNASADIYTSTDGITYGLSGSFSNPTAFSQVSVNITTGAPTRYVRIITTNNNVAVYWVSFSYSQTINPCGVLGTGLVVTGPDTDDDGKPNSYTIFVDSDKDGILNQWDLDSDNDGIPDVIEQGGVDADGDGRIDNFTDADKDGFDNRIDSDPNNDAVIDNPTGPLLLSGPDANNDGRADSYPLSPDGDYIPNYIDLDSDNDGIQDVIEAGGFDADGDGKVDNFIDADGDGYTDQLDSDKNNDGVIEGPNRPLIRTGADTNGDGKPESYPQGIGNIDGTGKPNPYDLDSDDDGQTDIYEAGGVDINNDGKIDAFVDTDGDGWANSVDGDANGDGVVENAAGLLVTVSIDANNDGRPDSYPTKNTDKNGLPDFLDQDSDNDGIPDIIEAGGVDTNGDGMVDGPYADTDGDGLRNAYDSTTGGVNIAKLDTDGDGVPNYKDLDSDNDGIQDVVEAGGVDFNGDGKLDNFNDADNDGYDDTIDASIGNISINNVAGPLILTGLDVNGDGRPDSYVQGISNVDGSGMPNPYDLDSDDDGLVDTYEVGSTTDANEDGRIDTFVDTDGDGWADAHDADVDGDGIIDNAAGLLVTTLTDLNNDGRPDSYPSKNTDKNGLPDFLDLDSDNDGIPDLIETGGVDTNGDGIIDGAYADADGDGIRDKYDFTTGGVKISKLDSDGDGIPNYKDLDSDDDGIQDLLEAGGVDNIADGRMDNFIDTDFDGLDDKVDSDISNNGSIDNAAGPYFVTGPDANNDGKPDYYIRSVANIDGTGMPNPYDLDSDDDGLTDIYEAQGIDANKDGRVDVVADTDGDGWKNNYDGDLDNNGTIETTTLIQTSSDSNGLGRPDSYLTKNSDNHKYPDFLDLDSDNDGIPDIAEAGGIDANGDGVIDGVYADSDGDGIRDFYDSTTGGFNIANMDTDNDGIPNYRDIDSDNDGIPDLIEAGGTDVDGNGRIDNLIDTDYDGFDDKYDADADHNGIMDNPTGSLLKTSAIDADANGIPDSYILNADNNADTDAIPNIWDLDSDNDGIQDAIEAIAVDANGNGKIDNFIDANKNGMDDRGDALPFVITGPDMNGDGRPDSYPQHPSNIDGSGRPNAYDLDSDDDCMSDIFEAEGVDVDGDGRVDSFADTDGDGWANSVDGDADGNGVIENAAGLLIKVSGDLNNDGRPDVWLTKNWDKTGFSDFLDKDSDDDGIPDVIEAGGTDTDGDGRVDGYTDLNGNGMNDDCEGVYVALDTDGDGIPDYHDLDSDNDGISDYIEGQGNTPIPPTGIDSDSDGIDDAWSKGTGTPYTTKDTDGDGIHDFRDWNTDGDTYDDWTDGFDTSCNGQAYDEYLAYAAAYEANTGNGFYTTLSILGGNLPDWLEDYDNNGIPNFLQVGTPYYHDTNGDGLIDLFDPKTGGTVPTMADCDADGVPNWRDVDNTNPLPVEFLKIQANWSNQDGKIDWFVASERNVQNYILEKQVNNQFVPIHSTAANHSTTYTAYDRNAQDMNHYRVKAVDVDGAVTYSSVVELAKENKLKVQVYPSPFAETLTIEWKPNTEASVRLTNTLGQDIINRTFTSDEQGKVALDNLQHLSKGYYYLHVIVEDTSYTFKVLK